MDQKKSKQKKSIKKNKLVVSTQPNENRMLKRNDLMPIKCIAFHWFY